MTARFPPGPNDHLLGLRSMSRIKADLLGSYSELQRAYGDSVSFRAGPYRFFAFFHPDQVREVLVTQAKSMVRLPRIMKTLAQWNGNSIAITEGEQWVRQRRLVQPAFQPKRMEHYGRMMVATARQLVESWAEAMGDVGYVDVDTDKAMTDLTLSVICKTMFDTEVADISAEIAEAVAVLAEVAFNEMQAPLRLPVWIPTRRNRRKRWAMDVLDRVVWRFVRERRKDGRDDGDLLSMLLAAVDEEAGTRLDDRQVRDEVTTLMLAGHDTTAITLDWLWHNIARSPEVAGRCREEIDSIVGSREPTANDVDKLHYVVATIKETLRLHPQAIGVFPRQAMSNLRVGGYDVPRGGLITLSSFVTQRDSRWFPEPERFAPERFLPGRIDEIPAGAYFPFGAGPRVCVGQSFAMMEMALIATSMLQSCEVTTIPGADNPTWHAKMALRPKEGLILRWKRRGA